MGAEPIVVSTSHTLGAFPGGAVIDSGDGAVEGDFYNIQVIEDAVIGAITLNERWSGGAKLVGKTLYQGQQITIRFTSITMSSGTVILAKLPKSA